MNRVLLVSATPTRKKHAHSNWAAPPVGLHRIAAHLRGKAAVDVYDPLLDTDEPDWSSYQMIGFSPTGETLPGDIDLMNRVGRVAPKARLLAGGPEATMNYQTIMDCSRVSTVVFGYGEYAMRDIVGWGPKRALDGTVSLFRGRRTTPLDMAAWFEAMSFADCRYEEYWRQTADRVPDAALNDVRTVRLVTSTHCNRGCSFCSVTAWHKQAAGGIVAPVVMGGEEVAKLVRHVADDLPEVRTIYFCEDDFCCSKERVLDFCASDRLPDGITYLVQTHSSHADDETIGTLAKAGCRHLTLGIENGSEKILRDLGKPQDLSRVPHIIDSCLAAGIKPYLLFILFTPTATMEDIAVNVDAIQRWQTLGATVSVEPFTMAYRGSKLHDSRHECEYEVCEGEGWRFKRSTIVLPDDPKVRDLMFRFRDAWELHIGNLAAGGRMKGATGIQMVGTLRGML